ncbi:MAG: hypothetical protein AAF725_07990 [Acidobacteriota bacterium]
MSEALRLFLVYGLASAAFLALAHRFVRPVGSGAALALVLLPLVSTGGAMVRGDFYGGLNISYHTPPLHAEADRLRDQEPEHGYANGPLMDQITQVVPWRKAVRELVKSGHPPLLNRFSRGGDPLLGGSQAAPFDPKVWIGFLLPLATAVTFACSFVLFQAALFTFLLLREYELDELSAIFGGAIFMLCGFLDFYLTWSLTSVVVALPLLLLGLRRIALGERGGFAASVVAWLLALAGGHPESVLHVTTLGGVYFLAHLPRSPSVRRAFGLSIAAGLVSFGLAAPVVFPFIEVLPQTHDYWARQAHHPDPSLGWVELARSALGALYPFAWGEPWAHGSAELPERFHDATGAFVGAVALGFALLGLIAGPPARRGFGLMAALTFLVALGVPWLSDLIASLPLFSISLSGRLTFATSLALAVLAAFGFDSARRDPTRGRMALLVAVALAVAGGALWRLETMRAADLLSDLHRASILPALAGPLLAALAGLLIRASGQRASRRLGLAWMAIFLLCHRGELPRLYHSFDPSLFYPPVAELAELPTGGEPYRVLGRFHDLVPGQSALWELEDARGPWVLAHRRVADLRQMWCELVFAFFCRAESLEPPLLDLMNVRYSIGAPQSPEESGWPAVRRGANAAIFENPDALPRVFAPAQIDIVRPGSAVLHAMAQATEFRSLAWVEDEQLPAGRGPNGKARITTRADGPDLRVSLGPREGDERLWLLVSQVYWSGWRAVAEGGERLTVRPANHAFFAVLVPPGVSEIHLFYRPAGWVYGWWVCGFTVLLAALGSRFLRRRGALDFPESPDDPGGA